MNTNLSTMVYGLSAAPAGASPTNFVSVDLDPAQRAGMLTDAGFITTRARSTGVGVVPRGLGVKALFTCLETPGPPDSLKAQVAAAGDKIAHSDGAGAGGVSGDDGALQQLPPVVRPVRPGPRLVRRHRPLPDDGRPRQADRRAHDAAGAASAVQTVQSAVELADVLSKSDVFTNCMATTMLKYALLDATVELPLPLAQQKGCAAAGIAHAMRTSSKQSFTDLIKATATSPAFAHPPADPVARRTPHDRSPSEVSENDLVSVQTARVHDRHERRRRAQDPAAKHGSRGPDDEVSGASAGHPLACRHRRGLRTTRSGSRRPAASAGPWACSRSPTMASAPT